MSGRAQLARMAIALLALLGLLDSLYLTLNRYQSRIGLICPVGGGCETVQESIWSTVPPGGGVPVALIGLVGYSVILLLALAGLQRDTIGPVAVAPALLLLASGGMLFSVYLTAIQLWVLRTLCFWCIISALLELGIFAAAIVGWIEWRRNEAPRSDVQAAVMPAATRKGRH